MRTGRSGSLGSRSSALSARRAESRLSGPRSLAGVGNVGISGPVGRNVAATVQRAPRSLLRERPSTGSFMTLTQPEDNGVIWSLDTAAKALAIAAASVPALGFLVRIAQFAFSPVTTGYAPFAVPAPYLLFLGVSGAGPSLVAGAIVAYFAGKRAVVRYSLNEFAELTRLKSEEADRLKARYDDIAARVEVIRRKQADAKKMPPGADREKALEALQPELQAIADEAAGLGRESKELSASFENDRPLRDRLEREFAPSSGFLRRRAGAVVDRLPVWVPLLIIAIALSV